MKKLFFVIFTFLILTSLRSQVTNTSFIQGNGEKVLQLSIVIPVTIDKAWEIFSKDENLMKWMAPVAHIDLKTGGSITTNYDKSKSLSDSTSIHLDIVNYLEKEILTLKVNLNKSFPGNVMNEDDNLQEILQFEDAGSGNTRIISSMVGWGSSKDWETTYGFFEKGNIWTFEQILELF